MSSVEAPLTETNLAAPDAVVSKTVTVGAATAKSSQSVAERWLRVLLPPLLLGLLIIGLWYLVSYGILDERRRFLLRPPHQVWAVGFADWANFSEILGGLWSSTQVAMIGLAIAIAIGFTLSTLMSQSQLIERAVFPYAVTLQAIPILAIVPLIGFWFGFG